MNNDSQRKSMNGIMNSLSYNDAMANQTKRKPEISLKQFDYIYRNKILGGLNEKHDVDGIMKGKFQFTDMNLLLNAYEYWKYENINKQTFHQLDQQDEDLAKSTNEEKSRSSCCNCISEERKNEWSAWMSSP